MCCVIAVLLCLSIFESLRIREIRKAWKGFGDVEVSVGVRSIWRTWTPGSTEESTCVVRFLDLLFLVTWVLKGGKCCPYPTCPIGACMGGSLLFFWVAPIKDILLYYYFGG